MAKTILTNELIEAITKVGELIKTSEQHIAVSKASDAYAADEEIMNMLEEYRTHQDALTAEMSKADCDKDETAVKALQDRMNEIFTLVTNSPVYVAFKDASDEYEEFTNAVYAELEYAVTGHRHDESCTHDCSTCGGCH